MLLQVSVGREGSYKSRAWINSRESSLPLLWDFILSRIGDYVVQIRLRVIVEETERFLYTSEIGILRSLRRS